jgi:asparagine synthase (glutamine-hydrolysing)
MPGLVGIIGSGRSEERKEMLFRMVSCMMHEPFYISGEYLNDEIELAVGWVNHEGSFSDGMPLWNEKQDLCLIFQGEDFADASEISELKAKGHEFRSRDASYLIHLYEEKREDFYKTLNGRFCGVVVDINNKTATLFNDRFGLSRLYYHQFANTVFFASEAKSLLSVLPELRRLDMIGLGETYSCGCVLQNRTLYKDMLLVPGGSVWTFMPGQNSKKEFYFNPKTWEEQQPLDGETYYDELKNTWTRILPRYLSGREKIGISLTGGKDSRMIMAWAPCPPNTLPTYTFGGPYRECRDVRLARRVAQTCQQSHQVILVGEHFLKEFPELAARTVYLTDGTMNVSAAPDLYANQFARLIAPIRLTGNYGQEILRSSIAFSPRPDNVDILERGFARNVENTAKTYERELNENRLSFVAFKQVPWHHYSRLSIELTQLMVRSPYLDNDLVAISYRAPRGEATSIDVQLQLVAEGNPALAKIGTDRGLLYHSIPLMTKLIHNFEQFTFKAEYAYDYGMPQWLVGVDHKFKAFHLEKIWLGRHKFAHFRVWYRDPLSEYVKAVLLDPRTLSRPYLNGRQIEKIVNDHMGGIRNYTTAIHWLLTSELIQRQLIEVGG